MSNDPIRSAWSRLTTAGKAALALAVLALAFALPALYRLARAAMLPSPTEFSRADDKAKERAAQHAAAFDAFLAQVNGRSLFLTPSRPGEGPAVIVEEAPGEPGEAPSRYEGPAIAAIVLDSVWFADGRKLKAGGEEQDGLAVIGVNAPWEATVRWRGTEFKVPFFERDRVVLKTAGAASSTAPEKPADDEDDAEPSDAPASEPAPAETTPAAPPPTDTPPTPPAEQPSPPPPATETPAAAPSPAPAQSPAQPVGKPS